MYKLTLQNSTQPPTPRTTNNFHFHLRLTVLINLIFNDRFVGDSSSFKLTHENYYIATLLYIKLHHNNHNKRLEYYALMWWISKRPCFWDFLVSSAFKVFYSVLLHFKLLKTFKWICWSFWCCFIEIQLYFSAAFYFI